MLFRSLNLRQRLMKPNLNKLGVVGKMGVATGDEMSKLGTVRS